MWWIIIIATVVIVALAFWMISGEKEAAEPKVEPEAEVTPEVKTPEVETPEVSDEDKPTMQ